MKNIPFIDMIDVTKPFALIEKRGRVICYQGQLHELKKLQDIHDVSVQNEQDVVFVLPYHMIRERGFEAQGDEPILALSVSHSFSMPKEDVIAQIAENEIALTDGVTPSISDQDYIDLVAEFQEKEIEGGNTSQTILSRRFMGQVVDFDLDKLLFIYKQLLQSNGQYMTVLFANIDAENPENSQFITAATPERHLEITGNECIMNPIAGTLRKEDIETFPERLEKFLHDPKEINELYQVVDEELKMMGVIAPQGGVIKGPFMREIGAVVHTEYELLGKRTLNSIDALRDTLHAPTVVGSPMESAARIISEYEPCSRRYYAGEIGVYKRPRTNDANGDLDCAILIRGAEFFGDGRFFVQAGGGLVRDSDPASEAKESEAKAMGMLAVLTGSNITQKTYMTAELHQKHQDLLASRNDALSTFWFDKQNKYETAPYDLSGMSVTIINNEDDFAHMIGHLLKVMHVDVTVMDTFDYDPARHKADITVIGPGPGDPNDQTHPRMKKIQEIIAALKAVDHPILGVCLGHQSLAIAEGLTVQQQTESTQGVQRLGIVLGKAYKLGFYNSFSAIANDASDMRDDLEIDLDDEKRVIAMQGKDFVGFQFHPESVMSEEGAEIMFNALTYLRR